MHSTLYQEIKESSERNDSYFDLDQPSPSMDDYYRMDFKPAPRTRSWTVESGISDISFLSDDTQGSSWNGDGLPCFTKMTKMSQLSLSPCSLPSQLSVSHPCPAHMAHVTGVSSDHLPGKLRNNPNYLSKESTNRRMIRSSQSNSCLSEPEQLSPVLMFLPKILRSSFSKIMSIPRRSKSPVSNKNSMENDCLPLSEEHRNQSSTSLVSPITEEIVSESLEAGLPIIPFAHPTFQVTNTAYEEERQSTRKNSLKNLKMAFCENKRKNRSIYKEEEEISEGQQRPKSWIFNDISGENVDDEESVKDEVKDIQSQSSYVEMSPVVRNHSRLECHSTKNNFGEEPYMCMNDLGVGEKKVKSGFSRKFSEEQIFHLEQGSPNQREVPSFKNDKQYYSTSSKNVSRLSMSEGSMSMERGLSRLHRKGNKHKADYVFVDFEKNNYVDMQQIGTKKWKFLTFHSPGKKSDPNK